jgi:2-dehydro-3-deoxygluconokinase
MTPNRRQEKRKMRPSPELVKENGMTLRVASVGECMIELSQRDSTTLGLAYGGDTLNTALYLARVAPRDQIAVDYVTALGDDPYSEAMIALWQSEGIGTASVARLPGKLPGLYLIRLDEKGERRFFYYRSAAAARELFRDARTLGLAERLPDYDLVYFSAITLSILDEGARDRFLASLQALRRRGGRVAFDTNYRPAGWPSRETAQAVVTSFMREADIALPTADDEAALFGDADVAATARRYAALGVREVAIKRGAEGCLLLLDGVETRLVPVEERVQPVDTTAAGDSFNAGYLALRLAGRPPEEAARAGHRLAGAKVRHRGAIMPRDSTPALFDGTP